MATEGDHPMTVTMRGNFIFVQPGQKAYKVASNFTNYLELGLLGGTDYYLLARVENDEFLIDAQLHEPNTGAAVEIKDNFPIGDAVTREMLPNGYRVLDSTGELMIGIEVDDNICMIRGRITAGDGSIIAESSQDDFLIYRGPAVLGKSGEARGLVLA